MFIFEQYFYNLSKKQKILKKVIAKKNLIVIVIKVFDYGCVAQLVEQLTLNQWVWGSNPHAPTITKSLHFGGFFVMVIEACRV